MARQKTITLTPIASDPNAITTSETLAAARLTFLINGAQSTGFDADGIAASQTPTGANAMTLNGALGTDFRARKGAYVTIGSAGADTGRTFTVVGKDVNDATLTEAITGPGAGLTVISSNRFYSITSVTPDAATAGAITVGVNGYATFATAQHISITSAGDDSGDTFTIVGEDRYGNALTTTLTGIAIGAALGTDNYARVDKVSSSGASAAGVEVGVDGLCESQWFVVNYRGTDFNVGFGIDFSTGGAMTFKVSHTFSNVLAGGFVEGDAIVFDHETVTGKTAADDGNYTNPPVAIRLAITAHTSGSANFRIVQGGAG